MGERVKKATAICLLTAAAGYAATFRIDPVPAAMVQKMRGVTWHEGCPVGPQDLRQLTVTYRNFAADSQTGLLIVNKEVAGELKSIFELLYKHRFPIAHISPIEDFGGNDDASMAANNTSAFNCRDTTGRPGVFSNHSWGRAIDINPLINPYVKGDIVLPPRGRAYIDRTRDFPGSILKGSYIVRIFDAAGWTWGGRWADRQDYQHFEKPAAAR